MPVPTRLPALLLLLALAGTGCGLFTPRTPDPPVNESGTYAQPDTPDQVVDNLTAAVAELNTQNYRRAFGEAFVFTPTATARARDGALWDGWGRAEEERYFSTLAADARFTTGNELRLTEQTLSVVGEDRFVLDAAYVLTAKHRRGADLPTTVQGRLVWALDRADDGLWYLSAWTDQALGGSPSWSDLKAVFVQ